MAQSHSVCLEWAASYILCTLGMARIRHDKTCLCTPTHRSHSPTVSPVKSNNAPLRMSRHLFCRKSICPFPHTASASRCFAPCESPYLLTTSQCCSGYLAVRLLHGCSRGSCRMDPHWLRWPCTSRGGRTRMRKNGRIRVFPLGYALSLFTTVSESYVSSSSCCLILQWACRLCVL